MKLKTQKLVGSSFSCLFVFLILAGCASTAKMDSLIYNEWSDDNYTHSEVYVKRLVIIGAINNAENREVVENAFVESFAEIDVVGFSSLDFMSVETKINKENVKKAIEGRSIDAVLVTELVEYNDASYRKGPEFENSYANYSTSKQYFEAIGVFDSNAPDNNSPDNFDVKKTVLVRVALYNLSKGKLVWSANSRSIEPKSADEALQALTQQIAARLREKNLI